MPKRWSWPPAMTHFWGNLPHLPTQTWNGWKLVGTWMGHCFLEIVLRMLKKLDWQMARISRPPQKQGLSLRLFHPKKQFEWHESAFPRAADETTWVPPAIWPRSSRPPRWLPPNLGFLGTMFSLVLSEARAIITFLAKKTLEIVFIYKKVNTY